MGLLDWLFGRSTVQPHRRPGGSRAAPRAMSEDERALERYRYLLRTAPPETVEQAHEEAFARLTPEQRRMVLQELSQELPEAERAAALQSGAEPRALARTATRAEMSHPGTLERRFGGMGMGFGGMMAGSFLSTMAAVVVGSAIADAFFSDSGHDGTGDAGAGDESGDTGGDSGDGDFGGADTGDSGSGDFGGGDFGDFGGGDFGGGEF